MTELRECPNPWCGSTEITVRYEPNPFTVNDSWCECAHCHVRSPYSLGKGDAIAAWNDRPEMAGGAAAVRLPDVNHAELLLDHAAAIDGDKAMRYTQTLCRHAAQEIAELRAIIERLTDEDGPRWRPVVLEEFETPALNALRAALATGEREAGALVRVADEANRAAEAFNQCEHCDENGLVREMKSDGAGEPYESRDYCPHCGGGPS